MRNSRDFPSSLSLSPLLSRHFESPFSLVATMAVRAPGAFLSYFCEIRKERPLDYVRRESAQLRETTERRRIRALRRRVPRIDDFSLFNEPASSCARFRKKKKRVPRESEFSNVTRSTFRPEIKTLYSSINTAERYVTKDKELRVYGRTVRIIANCSKYLTNTILLLARLVNSGPVHSIDYFY